MIEFLILLEFIQEQFDNKKVTKRAALEIMKIIKKENITGVSGDYNKLNSRFLEKLTQKGYIIEYNERPKKIKLKKQGFNRIYLITGKDNNKKAIDFYKKTQLQKIFNIKGPL